MYRLNLSKLFSDTTYVFVLGLIIVICLLITSCSTNVEQEYDSDNPRRSPAQEPFEQLSDYGLFKGELKELNPVEGMVPYDLNTELFSDYAKKRGLSICLPEHPLTSMNHTNLIFRWDPSWSKISFTMKMTGSQPWAGLFSKPVF